MLSTDGDIYNFCLSNKENRLYFDVTTNMTFDQTVKYAAKIFKNKYKTKHKKLENNATGYPLIQI